MGSVHNNCHLMKKYFAIAVAAIWLLGLGTSCLMNDPSEDNAVSIVCTTMDASDITANSATLNGSVSISNAAAEKAELWFVIGLEENALGTKGERISVEAVPSTGGYVSVLATELEAQTRYYYVLCVSIDGQEASGEVESFITLSEPKEPTVTTGDATDVSLFTATLNGSLTVESEGTQPQSACFFYSDSASGVEELKASGQNVPAELEENGSFAVSLSALNYNTSYYFVACAKFNDIEYYGEVKSFKTPDLPSDAIDLGLSVKWAAANFGAVNPEDYGYYYAWGETETKDNYSQSTYKWFTGTLTAYSKYNTDPDYGPADNKTELDFSDDVVNLILGGKWRMPCDSEWKELLENCTWTWTQSNGVNGYLVTSKKNDASIFLPAAGYREKDEWKDVSSYGRYWSTSLFKDFSDYAWDMSFNADDAFMNHHNRFLGYTIRPVLNY